LAIYRAQISFPVDSVLPADAFTITPHYQGDDAVALANMLKSNLSAFSPIGATKPFTIRVYDAQKAPPSYPLAVAEQSGTPPASNGPRELCLCLSYYATYNRPRFRGRLYIPAMFTGTGYQARPTGSAIAAALGWHAPLAVGLPSGTTFSVYSRMDAKAYTVSDFWVDDEWDVLRSRGRKSTTRQTVDLYP
jgi:hypothetical protein